MKAPPYQRGKFHVSHDESLHTIIKLQNACDPSKDATVEQQWKTTCFADKNIISVPLLYMSIDLFTIFVLLFQIYLVKSKREFWRTILVNEPYDRKAVYGKCSLTEANEEGFFRVFASVRLVLTCVGKALHGLTSDFHVFVLK